MWTTFYAWEQTRRIFNQVWKFLTIRDSLNWTCCTLKTTWKCLKGFVHSPQPGSGLRCSGEPPAGTGRRTVTASWRCVTVPSAHKPLPGDRFSSAVFWWYSGLSSELGQHVWLHLSPRRCEVLLSATWCLLVQHHTPLPKKKRPPSPSCKETRPCRYKHSDFSR